MVVDGDVLGLVNVMVRIVPVSAYSCGWGWVRVSYGLSNGLNCAIGDMLGSVMLWDCASISLWLWMGMG